jgi:3-oxoacyl-[acyl-carrier protein] reductase
MISIDLSGRTAVVTGGGQGIGAATAALLAEAGANVVLNYLGDPEGINRARAEATAQGIGDRAVALEADVRDSGAVASLFATARERFGSVEILVANAGVLRDRTIAKMSDREWNEVIETNLTGTFTVCREAARTLADGGRIITVSSISGVIGFFGQTNYAASKAGVLGLTKALSRELAKRRITVNAVAPGIVLTEMGRSIPVSVREEMLRSVPLGRFGEPREIARVVLFLASDLSSYVTGQLLQVNGGWIG